MKISVLLVEDEIASMRHLNSLIEKYCPKFRVVAHCENGQDALLQIKNFLPELVITDIRMPVMDGIELMANIRRQYPETAIIILSGYRDFEYAQSGLRQGALNYILKPISPRTLQSAMEEAAVIIERKINEELADSVHMMIHHIPLKKRQLERCFPEGSYCVALIRKNGLPKKADQRRQETTPWLEDRIIGIHGRDDNELFLMLPSSSPVLLEEYLAPMGETGFMENAAHTTAVLFRHPLAASELSDAIPQLCRAADHKMILGNSLHALPDEARQDTQAPLLDNAMLKSFEYYAAQPNIERMKLTLKRQLRIWIEEKCPLAAIREAICQMLDRIKRDGEEKIDAEEYYGMVEDAFFDAASPDKLFADICGILDFAWAPKGGNFGKLDTPEYFSRVEEYIARHLSGPLSLQDMCRRFYLSQAYLSRLFRKYSGMSFNQYLTHHRIELAKSLMGQTPEMRIRDIASLAGFSDQFYFSKLFKNVTGMTPTQYMCK